MAAASERLDSAPGPAGHAAGLHDALDGLPARLGARQPRSCAAQLFSRRPHRLAGPRQPRLPPPPAPLASPPPRSCFPARCCSRLSKRVKLVRDIVREVAGQAPYEKRIMELLKVRRRRGCCPDRTCALAGKRSTLALFTAQPLLSLAASPF